MANPTPPGGQPAWDDLALSGLLDRLRKALVEDKEAAAAFERIEHIPWGSSPDAVCCTIHEPAGPRVVRWGDIKPLAQARRERARSALAAAYAAVYNAAGDDLDPALLDALCERVGEEAEAWRVVGEMEDYAEEHEGGVANETYRRAQANLDRAIAARERAQTDAIVRAEERSRSAPPPSRPRVRTARPRAPRRSQRSRAAATPAAATATAGGDPPPPVDGPPLRVSPAALLAALLAADPATRAKIRDALGDLPCPRFVPSESQRALWAYLFASPVARSLDLLALDLRRAKRTVLRDFRVLESRGIVRRVEGGGLLVAPFDGNQTGTEAELTGTPSSGSVVSR